MELKVIYEHEEMRDMVVHVNSDGMQKIMAILADENNIITTQLTPRAPDVGVCTCKNVDEAHRGTWLVCGQCLKPRRR